MKTEWDNFTKLSTPSKIQIASIEDKALQKMTTQPNNILGYPSIHLLKNGNFISDYNQDRTTDKLLSFVNSQSKVLQGGGRRKSIRRKGKPKYDIKKKSSKKN